MLLNTVLFKLNGICVIMKIEVKKHVSFNQIILIMMNISLWCCVRIHLTVYILNYLYQFLIKL